MQELYSIKMHFFNNFLFLLVPPGQEPRLAQLNPLNLDPFVDLEVLLFHQSLPDHWALFLLEEPLCAHRSSAHVAPMRPCSPCGPVVLSLATGLCVCGCAATIGPIEPSGLANPVTPSAPSIPLVSSATLGLGASCA
jgi:hypothetical protein